MLTISARVGLYPVITLAPRVDSLGEVCAGGLLPPPEGDLAI